MGEVSVSTSPAGKHRRQPATDSYSATDCDADSHPNSNPHTNADTDSHPDTYANSCSNAEPDPDPTLEDL